MSQHLISCQTLTTRPTAPGYTIRRRCISLKVRIFAPRSWNVTKLSRIASVARFHRYLGLSIGSALAVCLLLLPAPLAAQEAPSSAHLSTAPPPVPVEQVVQRFAERESEFKRERDNFTYTQTFLFQTLDPDGQPDGEYRMVTDILFTPAGKRYEHVVEAPVSTIQRLLFTQEDEDDLRNIQPFVLTSDQLPKYDVKYIGREQVDELMTYVFDVAPKQLEKKERYFQGRIWVEDKDLNIVKTYGKVAYLAKKNNDQAFPHFETYRENIEGHFWFPTYTRANDVLHFKTSDVPIHMVVRYEKYKRFGSTIKIGPARVEDDPKKPEKPPNP